MADYEEEEIIEEIIEDEDETIIEEIVSDESGSGNNRMTSAASVDSGFSLHLPKQPDVPDDMTTSGFFDTGSSYHETEPDPFTTVSRESTASSPDTLTSTFPFSERPWLPPVKLYSLSFFLSPNDN